MLYIDATTNFSKEIDKGPIIDIIIPAFQIQTGLSETEIMKQIKDKLGISLETEVDLYPSTDETRYGCSIKNSSNETLINVTTNCHQCLHLNPYK